MKTIALLVAVILIPAFTYGQNNLTRDQDEAAIRTVVANLASAWKHADTRLWADQFKDDVDYTVWNGTYFHGREDNITGHQQIWDTFYKGTSVKFEVRKFRFLSENLAAVFLKAQMFRDGESYDFGAKGVVPLMILEKNNDKWLIAVFQNTPVINPGDPAVLRQPKQ